MMSKKKRQEDPNENSSESTDSCDENQNVVECPHIQKAVDCQKVKRTLAKTALLKDCELCKNCPDDDVMSSDFEYDFSLWLCLKCGHQACGRSRNQHALKHYETPHSDSHSMCVNTTIWTVWCYECDEEINVACKKKLCETVRYIKKHFQPEVVNDSVDDKMDVKMDTSSPDDVFKAPSLGSVTNNTPKVRGLTNLGNTCFFNSVMQCLVQTPYLVNLLEETSKSGCTFRLPGGKVESENKTTIDLEPLEGTVEEWKPLTRTLAETLRDLQNGHQETFVPRLLLNRLTNKLPQFGGGHQHDSHELLRHLLDAVREEDLKRYKTVILEKFGLRKSDPALVEDEKKKIIKFYGQQASELLLPTEQVFRGILVSTLQCQDCKFTSHRNEFFLDLSLPILESKVYPIVQRRKADELDENGSGPHLSKKEKRMAKRKNAKNQLNMKISSNNDNKQNSDSESGADIEDNVECKASPALFEVPKGTESGYNSDKAENGSPECTNFGLSSEMFADDSGVPSPQIGLLSHTSPVPCSPENSLESSETNIDMGSPGCGRNSPMFERPESRLSFANSKLPVDLSKLSLLNDGDSKKVDPMAMVDMDYFGFQSAAKLYNDLSMVETPMHIDEKMEEVIEPEEMWTNTITDRYQCEEGELSIQSCLNQFTACELMTGNNKVGCERCTQNHGGPDKKIVYTNATKQLLIYNPPAVLILHLKRFQVHRFCSKKVSKHVTFDFLLDLAPFCSKRSQNLPTIEHGQTNVLYSLYGVVEHSGSIRGGHYVAYVKVRPPLEENSYRWQFVPKYQEGANNARGAQGQPEALPGKWYYVSDSYVSEVSESKVLGSQAYLLFYERIL